MTSWKLWAYYAVLTSMGVFAVPQSNQCCEGGERLLRGGKCEKGGKILISCKEKVVVNPNIDNENYTVDENNNLVVFGDESYPPGEYCFTLDGNNEVIILCMGYSFEESELSWIIRATLALISSVSLILTIIVYALVPILRDLQGKCILNAVIGLAIGYMFLSAIQFKLIHDTFCVFVGFLIYFSFLLAFFWLNILSYNKWKTVVNPEPLRTVNDSFGFYCIYGYGVPLILLITALISHHIEGDHIKPGFNDTCWLEGKASTWIYFYGPLSVLLVLNIIFFSWTAKVLWNDFKQTDPKCRSLRYKFFLYLKLFVIMGLTWIFEVLSFAFQNTKNFMYYVWISVDYINALQGALIFTILVVLRKRALRGVAERGICCLKFPKRWETLPDEECEELVEDETKLARENSVNRRLTADHQEIPNEMP